MTPTDITVGAVLVALIASGLAGLTGWAWWRARRVGREYLARVRTLTTDLKLARYTVDAYRASWDWPDHPVDVVDRQHGEDDR